MSPTAPWFSDVIHRRYKTSGHLPDQSNNRSTSKTASFSGKNMLSSEEQGLGSEGALALSHSPPLSSCVTSGKLFTLSQPQSIKWG